MFDKEQIEIIEAYVKEGTKRGYTYELLIKPHVFKAFIDARMKQIEENKEVIISEVFKLIKEDLKTEGQI